MRNYAVSDLTAIGIYRLDGQVPDDLNVGSAVARKCVRDRRHVAMSGLPDLADVLLDRQRLADLLDIGRRFSSA